MVGTRRSEPSLLGAIVGMLVGFVPVAAFMAFLYSGLTWMPYSDDPCLNDTQRANFELVHAEQHQDAAAIAAAYDRGVAGLTACLRDPNRVGTHRHNYAASLVEVRRAAAAWHVFAATGGAWRDNPGRTPAVAEY